MSDLKRLLRVSSSKRLSRIVNELPPFTPPSNSGIFDLPETSTAHSPQLTRPDSTHVSLSDYYRSFLKTSQNQTEESFSAGRKSSKTTPSSPNVSKRSTERSDRSASFSSVSSRRSVQIGTDFVNIFEKGISHLVRDTLEKKLSRRPSELDLLEKGILLPEEFGEDFREETTSDSSTREDRMNEFEDDENYDQMYGGPITPSEPNRGPAGISLKEEGSLAFRVTSQDLKMLESPREEDLPLPNSTGQVQKKPLPGRHVHHQIHTSDVLLSILPEELRTSGNNLKIDEWLSDRRESVINALDQRLMMRPTPEQVESSGTVPMGYLSENAPYEATKAYKDAKATVVSRLNKSFSLRPGPKEVVSRGLVHPSFLDGSTGTFDMDSKHVQDVNSVLRSHKRMVSNTLNNFLASNTRASVQDLEKKGILPQGYFQNINVPGLVNLSRNVTPTSNMIDEAIRELEKDDDKILSNNSKKLRNSDMDPTFDVLGTSGNFSHRPSDLAGMSPVTNFNIPDSLSFAEPFSRPQDSFSLQAAIPKTLSRNETGSSTMAVYEMPTPRGDGSDATPYTPYTPATTGDLSVGSNTTQTPFADSTSPPNPTGNVQTWEPMIDIQPILAENLQRGLLSSWFFLPASSQLQSEIISAAGTAVLTLENMRNQSTHFYDVRTTWYKNQQNDLYGDDEDESDDSDEMTMTAAMYGNEPVKRKSKKQKKENRESSNSARPSTNLARGSSANRLRGDTLAYAEMKPQEQELQTALKALFQSNDSLGELRDEIHNKALIDRQCRTVEKMYQEQIKRLREEQEEVLKDLLKYRRREEKLRNIYEHLLDVETYVCTNIAETMVMKSNIIDIQTQNIKDVDDEGYKALAKELIANRRFVSEISEDVKNIREVSDRHIALMDDVKDRIDELIVQNNGIIKQKRECQRWAYQQLSSMRILEDYKKVSSPSPIQQLKKNEGSVDGDLKQDLETLLDEPHVNIEAVCSSVENLASRIRTTGGYDRAHEVTMSQYVFSNFQLKYFLNRFVSNISSVAIDASLCSSMWQTNSDGNSYRMGRSENPNHAFQDRAKTSAELEKQVIDEIDSVSKYVQNISSRWCVICHSLESSSDPNKEDLLKKLSFREKLDAVAQIDLSLDPLTDRTWASLGMHVAAALEKDIRNVDVEQTRDGFGSPQLDSFCDNELRKVICTMICPCRAVMTKQVIDCRPMDVPLPFLLHQLEQVLDPTPQSLAQHIFRVVYGGYKLDVQTRR